MHLRDLNLGLKGNTKMTTITYVEIMSNPQNPWNSSRVTFLFKDEGSLATHPLSCHPQRMFDSLESERKGDKMRENWEKRENSRLTNVLMINPFKVLSRGLYTAQHKQNYKNV